MRHNSFQLLRSAVSLGSTLMIAAIPASLSAATLYWDGAAPTGDADGGTGTWRDTTPSNWSTLATGGLPAPWVSLGSGNNASFGGVAGTVTISGGVTANQIDFTATGYTVTGSTLTLGTASDTTPGINVLTGGSAQIGSVLAGTKGLNFGSSTNLGTLTLTGASTFPAARRSTAAPS